MKKKHTSRKQIAIPITEFTDLKDLQNTYGLNRDTLVDCSIGWDGGVYLLYSACVPERIQGMFVDPHADTEYKALCLWINWEDGSLIGEELLLFGIQKMNLHFIQPVKDQILLLGARAGQYSDGTQDQNAVFVTRQGDPVFCTCMGDGIEQCIALEDGRIITSYFDEGVLAVWGMALQRPAAWRSGTSRARLYGRIRSTLSGTVTQSMWMIRTICGFITMGILIW